MEVFISWANEPGRIVAEALKTCLGTTLQSIEPFVSKDIEKGSRWAFEIADRLQNAVAGIVCLTPDSLTSAWLLYEAGALSKLKRTHVCTFLVNVRHADVKGPLEQFQNTIAEKGDVLKLMETLNKAVGEKGGKPLDQHMLARAFEYAWPALEEELERAKNLPTAAAPPSRTPVDMLEEIVEAVRVQDARLRMLVREANRQKEERALRLALLRPEATSPYANLGQNTLGSLAGYGTVAPFPPNNPNLASNVIVLSPSASASPSASSSPSGSASPSNSASASPSPSDEDKDEDE